MANGLLSDWMSGTGVYGSPNAIDPSTGVPYADVRSAQLGALGNIGSLLIAAGQPMTGAQRAQLLGQIGPQLSGMQTDIYNAAQRRLMQAQFAEKQAELADTNKIRDLMKDPEAFKAATGYDLTKFAGLGPSEIGSVIKQARVSELTRNPMQAQIDALNLLKLQKEVSTPDRVVVGKILYERDAQGNFIAKTDKGKTGQPLTPEEIKLYNLPQNTPAVWDESGIPKILKGGTPAAPTGQAWKRVPGTFGPDDPGELVVIEGGTASQLPAEIAGKVGIIDTFFERAPVIDEAIKAGDFSDKNIQGRLALATNVGQMGEINRIFKQGEDAIRRVLTGAGMAVSEADNYASQYLPQATDSEQTIKQKYDAMTKTLTNMRKSMTRGRGSIADLTPVGGKKPETAPASDDALINKYLNQ
jgi:hypothetical protein